MKVILVSVGNFQSYIIDNIKQLHLWGNKDIDIICDQSFFPLLKDLDVNLISKESLYEDKVKKFYEKSVLDRNFRNGFWLETSSRFFLIYQHMKNNNLENIIHLENDVISYINFDEYFHNCNYQMMLTMDSPNRCIPGILFIKNYNILEMFVNEYNFSSQNDMTSLANFYKKNKLNVELLPIINDIVPYNNLFENFNSIFDAAAIGQYLGGVDPRNISGDSSGFINETCIVKYNQYKFIWEKDNINRYYPVLFNKDKKIRINNLHIHSKNLQNFSSLDPIENNYIKKSFNKDENVDILCSSFEKLDSSLEDIKIEDIITGERYQNMATCFYASEKSYYDWNPYIRKLTKKLKFYNEVVDNYDNDSIIFCYSHNLNPIINKFKNPFILIIHNSDENIDDRYNWLLEVPNLVRFYSQNLLIKNEKAIPIGIGLANSQWPHGNLNIIYEVIKMDNKKEFDFFFNFSINTNKIKREDCYKKLINKGLKFLNNCNQKDYLLNLSKHKYCICPEGNGLDSHRFWECLYLGVIPIVLKNNMTEYFSKIYPVVLLNDWNDFDIEKLLLDYNNYKNKDYKKFLKINNTINLII